MKSMRFLFGLCLLGSAALGQEIQLTPTVVTSLATKAASNYFAANGSSSSAFTRSLSGATNSAAFVDIFGSWPVDAIGWQFSGLGYAVESRITSTNGGLLGNTNNVGYWTVYSISFIQQVTNDLIVTNLEMYGGGTYNGSSIQGWPSLWLYTFSSLPSQIVLNSAGTGYVTNFTYYDLKHEWNSHSPTSYYLTNGVPVSAGNYIVAIMRFDGNFGWWDANYFDTNSSSFINRFPLYGTNSDTTTLGMLDTNRYASAEMNVSGYYTTSATNFSQYTDYIKAGINSNIVLNAQTTNALVATNAVITNALISLSNNVVAQINSANSALQDQMRTNAPTTGFTTNLLAQSTADRFMGAFGTWKAQHISGFYDPAGLYYLTNTTDNIFPPYQTLYLHGLGFVQLVTNTAIVTNICVYVGGMDQATNCDVRVFVTNALPAYLSLSDPHCVFSTNTLVPAFASSTHFRLFSRKSG
jgi:hypothetical protein